MWLVSGLGAAGFLLGAGLVYERLRGVEGMGMGDVKLALCMGFFLGAAVIPALFIGFITGALAGIVLLASGRSAKTAIPFGPFLAFGAVVALALRRSARCTCTCTPPCTPRHASGPAPAFLRRPPVTSEARSYRHPSAGRT